MSVAKKVTNEALGTAVASMLSHRTASRGTTLTNSVSERHASAHIECSAMKSTTNCSGVSNIFVKIVAQADGLQRSFRCFHFD